MSRSPTARLHELAVQAARRIDTLGHDPVAAIEAALRQAVAEQVDPDGSYQALPVGQRAVVYAILSARRALTVREIGAITGRAAAATWWSIKRLKAKGILRPALPAAFRAARTWRLTELRPTRLRPLEDLTTVLEQVAHLPEPFTPATYARVCGIVRNTAIYRLRRAAARGFLVRVGTGQYAHPRRGRARRGE